MYNEIFIVNIMSFVFVVLQLNSVQLFATPQTVAHQTLLSVGLPRQEYWSGLPFPSLGDLPDPGIELMSPALAGNSLPLSHLGSPFELPWRSYWIQLKITDSKLRILGFNRLLLHPCFVRTYLEKLLYQLLEKLFYLCGLWVSFN